MKFCKGQLLKPTKCDKGGHVSVSLRGGSRRKPVHQLIMKTFVGEPKKGQEVCHINGIPTDNRLENLKYGTHSENMIDVYYQRKKIP